MTRRISLLTSAATLALWTLANSACGQSAAKGAPALTNATVLEMEGTVEIAKWRTAAWERAETNRMLLPGDRLRTGERSRAVLRLSNLSTLRLGEFSLIEIPGPEETGGFNFRRGLFYFFHRDKPATLPVRTPAMVAVIRGTEFNLVVEENGRTTLSLLEGAVEMSNQVGQITLNSGVEGSAEPGQAPRKTAVVNAVNIIQWALYYPAVLDVDELELGGPEQQALAGSLAAYRAGDLLGALAQYPAGHLPATDAEKIYLAGVVLAVGQVERAEALVTEITGQRSEVRTPAQRLAEALRQMIAAVKLPQPLSTLHSRLSTATECLPES